MPHFELVGSLRCAAMLSRMVREKEAWTMLIAANRLRVGKIREANLRHHIFVQEIIRFDFFIS